MLKKIRQRRPRIVQTLNVPQRYAFGFSLAAALLDGLFEPSCGNNFLLCRSTELVVGTRANY